MIAMVTDGAVTLASTNEGVTGKFLKAIPHLMSVHCMAHRLNLALKDSTKAEKKITSLHSTCYSLISYLKETAKRHTIFQECFGNDKEILELIQPFDIRWFTYYEGIKRLLKVYPNVMACLLKLKITHKDAAAEGYRRKLGKARSVLFMNVYIDTVVVMSRVCKKISGKFLEYQRGYQLHQNC
jgi:hypothetical protein